jgi:hypothetical protein
LLSLVTQICPQAIGVMVESAVMTIKLSIVKCFMAIFSVCVFCLRRSIAIAGRIIND